MNDLDSVFTWAQHNDFTQEELKYATILQLKILDEKCKMTPEDQEIFKRVYKGISAKEPSLFCQDIHQLIQKASSDELKAIDSYKDLIHTQRVAYEDQMKRPIMKAYKAMVRSAIKNI
jgi:hypothetical protein